MTLYSHNGATPAQLPARIRIPDGEGGYRTRTDPTSFTPEEIAAAGYMAAAAAPAPSARQLPATWDGSAWVLPDKPVATRQAEMDAALRARFRELLGEGCTVNGVVVDLEGESFVRLREGGEAIAGGGGISAVTVRRQAIDLPNQAAANAVRAAARDRYLQLAEAELTVFDAIFPTPAPTHDDLDLIDITSGTVDGAGGWP